MNRRGIEISRVKLFSESVKRLGTLSEIAKNRSMMSHYNGVDAQELYWNKLDFNATTIVHVAWPHTNGSAAK